MYCSVVVWPAPVLTDSGFSLEGEILISASVVPRCQGACSDDVALSTVTVSKGRKAN